MDRPKFCWDPTPGAQARVPACSLQCVEWNGGRTCRWAHRDWHWTGCPLLAVQRFFARFPLGNSNAAPFAWCTRNGGAGGGGTFEFATWVEKGFGLSLLGEFAEGWTPPKRYPSSGAFGALEWWIGRIFSANSKVPHLLHLHFGYTKQTGLRWSYPAESERKIAARREVDNLSNASHDAPIDMFSLRSIPRIGVNKQGPVPAPRSWIPAKLGPIHGE
ncbi:hypothetical protein FA13DRAFT_1777634 [Coprinellus micaceus]|uniref:Uncharacterized protein n=1 Tax=Coprinellus micaceus TaxID=71717 RepID=A0A4Y7ST23_COPMI|nr:hypothetical protein FA13DRAFT_1777634 [Coprinellus micaceus]